VRTCRYSGLQYWQHIVALAPTLTQPPQPHLGGRCGGRAARLHRDLLVFRRPSHPAAGEAAAAA
jgi:hypothetical protein